jgi:hypothetical protein
MRGGLKLGYIVWALLVAAAGAVVAYIVYTNSYGSSRGLHVCLVGGITAVISGILIILSFSDWWLRH